jgi:uncharacterized protein (TIGR03643 family)
MKTAKILDLSDNDRSRAIEMAWEDRTPFEAIKAQFGLNEGDVIQLMRRTLKSSSFRLWRARVAGNKNKHESRAGVDVTRAYCATQYKQRKSSHV